MSLGGSSSSSRSSSQSTKYGMTGSQGLNFQQSYLDPTQQGNQQALINQFMPALDTSGIAQGISQGVTGGNFGGRDVIERLSTPGTQGLFADFRNNLGGDVNAFRQNLAGQVPFLNDLRAQQQGAVGQLSQFASQHNPYINSQIQQFGQDISQQYREMLPGIGGQAQMAGQRGGSRQGIAEGVLGRGLMDQFSRGVADMRSQAYGQQSAASQALAGLTTQGLGQFQGLQQAGQAQLAGMGLQGAGQMKALQQAGLSGALSAIPGIAQAQLSAQLMPFQIGSQVIGAPSTLQTGLGMDSSFGYEYGTSQSKGKGSSAGLSIGL
jgi:hypothetical protein